MKQKTIKKECSFSGVGLHTGCDVTIVCKPADENTGINFVRVDLANKPVIPASISHVIEKSLKLRRTSLGFDSAEIHTVEHLLSALFGLGIDNIIIEVDAEEIPALNGSAHDFYRILSNAEVIELDSPQKSFTLREPFCLREDDAFLVAFPDDSFSGKVLKVAPLADSQSWLNPDLKVRNLSYGLK